MSKSAHVLKIKKNGTVYSCELYTTANEARNKVYPGQYIRLKKDGVNLYAPLTTTFNSATESTPLKVFKQGDNTEYCVAQKSFYRVNITPVANTTITATTYDNNYNIENRWTSGAKWLPYGKSIDISVQGNPNNIWMGGGIVTDPANTNTVINSNIEISATAATRRSYEFTLAATTHQTITVTYTEPGKSTVTKKSSSSVQYITVLAGTTWSATVAGATGYNPGTLQYGSSGTITDYGTIIYASAATLKTYNLKLGATTNQKITLKYTNTTNGTSYTKKSTTTAQSFTVGYGTKWTATLAADDGYTKGTLSASSGTVTAATTVSATKATAITPKITFNSSGDYTNFTVTYTNTSGTSKTSGTNPSSVTIKYNTKIKITNTKANNYYADYYLEIKQGSTYKDTITGGSSWTSGKLTSNTTFRLASSRSLTPVEGGNG